MEVEDENGNGEMWEQGSLTNEFLTGDRDTIYVHTNVSRGLSFVGCEISPRSCCNS